MNITNVTLDELTKWLKESSVDEVFNGLEKITIGLEAASNKDTHYPMKNLHTLFEVANYIENSSHKEIKGAKEFLKNVRDLKEDIDVLSQEIPVYDMYFDEVVDYIERKRNIYATGKEYILRQEILKMYIVSDMIAKNQYKLFNIKQILEVARIISKYLDKEISEKSYQIFKSYLSFAENLAEKFGSLLDSEEFLTQTFEEFLASHPEYEDQFSKEIFDYTAFMPLEEENEESLKEYFKNIPFIQGIKSMLGAKEQKKLLLEEMDEELEKISKSDFEGLEEYCLELRKGYEENKNDHQLDISVIDNILYTIDSIKQILIENDEELAQDLSLKEVLDMFPEIKKNFYKRYFEFHGFVGQRYFSKYIEKDENKESLFQKISSNIKKSINNEEREKIMRDVKIANLMIQDIYNYKLYIVKDLKEIANNASAYSKKHFISIKERSAINKLLNSISTLDRVIGRNQENIDYSESFQEFINKQPELRRLICTDTINSIINSDNLNQEISIKEYVKMSYQDIKNSVKRFIQNKKENLEEAYYGKLNDYQLLKINVRNANKMLDNFYLLDYKFIAMKDLGKLANEVNDYVTTHKISKKSQKFFGEFMYRFSKFDTALECVRKEDDFDNKTLKDILKSDSISQMQYKEFIKLFFQIHINMEPKVSFCDKEWNINIMFRNYLNSSNKENIIAHYRQLLSRATTAYETSLIEGFLNKINNSINELEPSKNVSSKKENEVKEDLILDEFITEGQNEEKENENNSKKDGTMMSKQNVTFKDLKEDSSKTVEHNIFEEKKEIKSKLNALLYDHILLGCALNNKCNIDTLFKYQKLLNYMNQEYALITRNDNNDRYMSSMDDVSCDCAYGNGLILEHLLTADMENYPNITIEEYEKKLLEEEQISEEEFNEKMSLSKALTENVGKLNNYYARQSKEFKSDLYMSQNSVSKPVEENVNESRPAELITKKTKFSKLKKIIATTGVCLVTGIATFVGYLNVKKLSNSTENKEFIQSMMNENNALKKRVAGNIVDSHTTAIPENIIESIPKISTAKEELLKERALLEAKKQEIAKNPIIIGSEVNLNRPDAPLYLNTYDVVTETNPRSNYYATNEERTVVAVILEKDGDIKNATTNEELNELEQRGYIRQGYALINQYSKNNQDIEGRFAEEDISLITR